MTANVSQTGLTPVFEVLKQDTNDVIAFINYIIERGETTPGNDLKKPKKGNSRNHKIKDDFWKYI